MSGLQGLQQAVEKFILDPKRHDALMLIKSFRNGLVYGTKIRFPHALVMVTLFRNEPLRQKAYLIFQATKQHARNLAFFATIYRATMLLLRRLNDQKEGYYDSFIAGMLGGYAVFGRGRSAQNSVKQQIVIYIFARVCIAYAKLLMQPRERGGYEIVTDPRLRELVYSSAWPLFASINWGCVMFIFRKHPEVIGSSLKNSMNYIYVNSDYWTGFRNYLIHNT